MFAAIATIASAFAGPHGPSTTGGVTLEAWQIINLVGAPLLAILFVRPVIDDVRAWLTSIRER